MQLRPPATSDAIERLQKKINAVLPADFLEFYSVCNGFEYGWEMFKIKPIEDILSDGRDHGRGWFSFSDYLIHSEVWCVNVLADGGYEMFYRIEHDIAVLLTQRLSEFLEHVLQGSVFDPGGLMEWQYDNEQRQGLR